jgi:hypothetical protein
MAPQKPRIGCDNLLWDNRLHLRATTELSDEYPVENLADWTAGRYWKPTFVSNPPATEYVYVYPLDTEGRIEVRNWYFRDWTNGPAAAPDNWTLTGAAASVARDADPVKVDQYSAEITRAGTDCYLSQDIEEGWQAGQEVTLGAWVHCGTADRARISLHTDTGSTASAYHAGTGAWVWLDVTHEIEFDATTLEIRLEVNGGDVAANFDGIALYLGDSIDETPHEADVDYLAAHDHNFHSGGLTVSLEYSASASDWSTPATLATLDPDSDASTWKSATKATAAAWRVKFLGAAGSQPASVAVLSFGKYLELPDWLDVGFDPYRKEHRSELVRAKSGPPIQRGIKREPARVSWSLQWVGESTITGILTTFWRHAAIDGLAFFFQWEDGDHDDSTLFCSLPEGATFAAPLSEGYRVQRFNCEMEVVNE